MALRQIGGLVEDYAGLVNALRQRLQEVASPLEAIDHLLGLPASYTSKLVNRKRTRVIGRVSLSLLLEGLGLRLVVMVDDEAFESKYQHRLRRRRFDHWSSPQPVLSRNEIRRASRREMSVHSEDLGHDAVMAAAQNAPALRRAAVVVEKLEPKRASETRPPPGLTRGVSAAA